MSSTIDFSQFAYRATKPRLTFYERRDKENRPDAPPKQSIPINAAQTSSPKSLGVRHRGPGSSEKTVTVVAETPDDERLSMNRGCDRRRPTATGKQLRRKRLRLSSTSSESENESRETDQGGGDGGARETKLFSTALVSKRRKRSGGEGQTFPVNDITSKPSLDTSIPQQREHTLNLSNSTEPASGDKSNVELGVRESGHSQQVLKKKLSDNDDDDEEFKEFNLKSDLKCSVGKGRGKKYESRPHSSFEKEDGWLTSRRKPQSNRHTSFNGINDMIGGHDDRGEVGHLRELFPQYSDEFLRQQLHTCTEGMNEAIANILTYDDSSSKRQLSSSQSRRRPKGRRLYLPSDDDSISDEGKKEEEEIELPDISWSNRTIVGGKVKGGRRLQLLNESIDDDDNTSQPTIISESNRHLTHHNHILSSSIESDNTGEKTAKRESDEREEGEERGRASKREVSPDLEMIERELSDQSHYSDENDFSDKQKTSILSLLNSLSIEEACAIPGCSETKATLLLADRPFKSWENLVKVIASTKGLSEKLLDGCVRLLEERKMLARLLTECQNISSSIERHVDTIRERKEKGEADDSTNFTLPTMLSPDLVLKPYQKVGVSWLALLHSQSLNAILADEMGLGKTVQAIAFLCHLYENGWKRPHLVVVPASTLDNWARELERWSPSLNVLTYWGSLSERAAIRQEVMYGDCQDYYDVILSTYTMCIGRTEDRKFFRKLQLKTLILDEGHMLKNMATQKYNHLMKMQAERRLLLTGTPLQNNLLELMSLLSFVMPSVFRPYLQLLQTAFRRHTSDIGTYYTEQVLRAKEIMRPFILRRLKKEVLSQLPDKIECVERCPLTPEQWELYSRLVEEGKRDLKKGTGKVLVGSMSVITNLRKAANHPLLLRNHYTNDIIKTMSSEILKEAQYRDADCQLIAEDMMVMSDFELHNLCLKYQSLQQYCLAEDLIKESGKLKYLEKKLIECKEQGDRMLLFSQFTMVLDIVEAWLQLLGHTHLRLDGSTPMNIRQDLIDEYNNDTNILVFLLSTKAGGLGINLTSANVVVLHDIDFNPYNDKQAEDRCHRVGQTKAVEVVRLVGRDTIEEQMLKCGEQKLKLEQDMTTGNQLSKSDIASLLTQSLKL